MFVAVLLRFEIELPHAMSQNVPSRSFILAQLLYHPGLVNKLKVFSKPVTNYLLCILFTFLGEYFVLWRVLRCKNRAVKHCDQV